MASFTWQHHLPQQQLLQKQVELGTSRNLAYISGQFQHVLLTEGFGCDAMSGEPGRVKIRPPPPRQQDVNKEPALRGPSCEPQPRPIIRRRARSLPCSRERNRGASRESRSQRVRFVDSLGLELAEVKVFRAGEDPTVPLHVLTRLMLSSELASGRDLVIPIPYLEPDFPPQSRASERISWSAWPRRGFAWGGSRARSWGSQASRGSRTSPSGRRSASGTPSRPGRAAPTPRPAGTPARAGRGLQGGGPTGTSSASACLCPLSSCSPEPPWSSLSATGSWGLSSGTTTTAATTA